MFIIYILYLVLSYLHSLSCANMQDICLLKTTIANQSLLLKNKNIQNNNFITQMDYINKISPIFIQTDFLKLFFKKYNDESYLKSIYLKLEDLCYLKNSTNMYDEFFLRDIAFITIILYKINEEKKGIYDIAQVLLLAYRISKLPINQMINSIRDFFADLSEIIDQEAASSETCSNENSILNKLICLIKEKKWILPILLITFLYYFKQSFSSQRHPYS